MFAVFDLAAEDFPLPAHVPRVTQPLPSPSIATRGEFEKTSFPVCCNLNRERKLRGEILRVLI